MAAFLYGASYLEPVGMGVDKARHDGFACHVTYYCTRWQGNFSGRADADDAVVDDDDIGVGDDILSARHRNHRRAAQYDTAPWHVARQIDRQVEAGD